MKSAEGQTQHCITHGGGTRCSYPAGCSKAARGRSGFCIKHGGGKRCVVESCTRSAEGQLGLCISHGGGRRCRFHDCKKGAQGSTMFCKAPGGGKRCVFNGCTKGAEGTTPLCKAHGGGKRCLYEGGGICPKSVHGGTDYSVAHGDGKRYVVPGCTKSTRGWTNCCVKHGGGRSVRKAPKEAPISARHTVVGRSAFGAVKGNVRSLLGEGVVYVPPMVTCHTELKKAMILFPPRLFYGLVSGLSDNHSLFNVSAISNTNIWLENPDIKQQRIPSQLLVPSSMKSSSFVSFNKQIRSGTHNTGGRSELVVPEGRVHGGGLLSLPSENLRDAVIDGI